MALSQLRIWTRLETFLQADELPSVVLAVAADATAYGLFQSIGQSLREMSANQDPIYRELALGRLRQISEEASAVATGRIEFHGTEAWRRAYEQLLRSRGLYSYRSVAYACTPNYWQDEPGRQSMQVNLELASSGLAIQRIVIVPEAYWPQGERFPVEPLGKWLDQQVRGGIEISIVAGSLLSGDLDLMADFGLYGNRAVGFQRLDEQGRTLHFSLSFDFAELLATERRWDRLTLHATPYEALLQKT